MDALVDTPNLVAQIDAFGFEHLRTLERPLDPLSCEEIRIRVRAASLNYRDLQVALGRVSNRISDIQLPLVPLSDCAGEVIEIGSSVDAVRLGDRVCLAPLPAWTAGRFRPDHLQSALGGAVDGVLATYVSGHQRSFVQIPETLSFEEAATLPTAALSAWNALFELGDLKPGQTLLVQGSGGVSIFALQFALAAGARVFALTGSPSKMASLQALGAEQVVLYKSEAEWSRAILELTGGDGVDHVVETCGAATIDESIKAAAVGGSICLVGLLSGAGGRIDMLPLLAKTLHVHGVVSGSVEMLERMVCMIEHLGIRPVIDQEFEMRDLAAAFEHLSAGRHVGKIVVRV